MIEDIIEDKYKLNPDKWITPPKTKKYNLTKKYSLTITFIVIGLILVSITKNETRKLQNEINDLQSSVNKIKGILYEATLDYQVITSPENISELANKHLEPSFIHYKRSQIKQLYETENFSVELAKPNNKKNKELSDTVKLKVVKKIESTKTELKKLQELYSSPGNLTEKIKLQLSQKISEKQKELKKLYTEPKNSIKISKVQKWAAVQVVKAFLGIPTVPGK